MPSAYSYRLAHVGRRRQLESSVSRRLKSIELERAFI